MERNCNPKSIGKRDMVIYSEEGSFSTFREGWDKVMTSTEMARKANQILDEVQRRAGEKILIPVREQIINEMINENETHNTRNK